MGDVSGGGDQLVRKAQLLILSRLNVGDPFLRGLRLVFNHLP